MISSRSRTSNKSYGTDYLTTEAEIDAACELKRRKRNHSSPSKRSRSPSPQRNDNRHRTSSPTPKVRSRSPSRKPSFSSRKWHQYIKLRHPPPPSPPPPASLSPAFLRRVDYTFPPLRRSEHEAFFSQASDADKTRILDAAARYLAQTANVRVERISIVKLYEWFGDGSKEEVKRRTKLLNGDDASKAIAISKMTESLTFCTAAGVNMWGSVRSLLYDFHQAKTTNDTSKYNMLAHCSALFVAWHEKGYKVLAREVQVNKKMKEEEEMARNVDSNGRTIRNRPPSKRYTGGRSNGKSHTTRNSFSYTGADETSSTLFPDPLSPSSPPFTSSAFPPPSTRHSFDIVGALTLCALTENSDYGTSVDFLANNAAPIVRSTVSTLASNGNYMLIDCFCSTISGVGTMLALRALVETRNHHFRRMQGIVALSFKQVPFEPNDTPSSSRIFNDLGFKVIGRVDSVGRAYYGIWFVLDRDEVKLPAVLDNAHCFEVGPDDQVIFKCY